MSQTPEQIEKRRQMAAQAAPRPPGWRYCWQCDLYRRGNPCEDCGTETR